VQKSFILASILREHITKMMIYGFSLSFLSKFELVAFSLIVMIASSFGIYDGRMAKIKAELTVIFNAHSVVKLELMEHYANTGKWPSSELAKNNFVTIETPTIENLTTHSDGSYQFLLNSPYAEINKKIIRFEPLNEMNTLALIPFRWQCRLYEQPNNSLTNNLHKITEGDYIPYICRDQH
jgi:hypothetical protein